MCAGLPGAVQHAQLECPTDPRRPGGACRHRRAGPRAAGQDKGAANEVITRGREAGWLNVGTYRMMVQDKNHVGLYLSPGKDARLHIERCWSRNEPCEVVAVWGGNPATFIAAS